MNTTRTNKRQWITLDECAEYLGTSARTVRRMISAGTIKAYRLGPRLVRIDFAELDLALRPIPTAA